MSQPNIWDWAAKRTQTDRPYNLAPGDSADVTFELVVVNDYEEPVTLIGIDWVPVTHEQPAKVVQLHEVTRWLRSLNSLQATVIAGLLEVRFS